MGKLSISLILPITTGLSKTLQFFLTALSYGKKLYLKAFSHKSGPNC